MSFWSSITKSIGNCLNFVGETVSNIVTETSNVVSNLAHDLYETTSNLTSGISEIVKSVPILSGVIDAAKFLIDGIAHGAEIVVEHFDMWVAEAGQIIGTVVSTVGDVVTDLGNLDICGIIDSIKDGIGTIVQKDIQFLGHHLTHDLALLQIPGEIISNGISSILAGVLGDNCISNAPKIISTIQHYLFETVLHESIINPILEAATEISESIFGEDLVSELSMDEMGMGSVHDGDYGCDVQLVGVCNEQLPELALIS